MKNGASVLRCTRVVCEISLAERAQLRGVERGHALGESGSLRRARRGPTRSRAIWGHVRQFHRAFDQRVARENLLEQRRARARQPDDEDRVRGRRAGGARAAKNSGVNSAFERATKRRFHRRCTGVLACGVALPAA